MNDLKAPTASMDEQAMYGVVLCGGSGTRLWPLSRKNFPKQFLNLYGDKSLVQATYLRLRRLMPEEQIFFVTNEDNLFNVINQVREIAPGFSEEQVIVEPESRNTAPAIACAVKYLSDKVGADKDSPIFFLPADHYIADEDGFVGILKKVAEHINGFIATIGIVPKRPETGYGYIKKGQAFASYWQAAEFREKPDRVTAEEYLRTGQYLWNSGMYAFTIHAFLRETKVHAPEIYQALQKKLPDFIAEFGKLPNISIDYAISEKSDQIIVFAGDFGWSDIGSFDSLAEISAERGGENPRHVGVHSKNVFVRSTNDVLVTTVGIEDVIVVENNDGILIQKMGMGESVKDLVACLREKNMKELEHQLLVHQPWGKYEVLIDTPTYKVKKITVYPGACFGLQSHFHRSEHWIVVKGVAKVQRDGEELYLRENESVDIPSMCRHKMENPGKFNLEMIEVQTGNYLGEDDTMYHEGGNRRVV